MTHPSITRRVLLTGLAGAGLGAATGVRQARPQSAPLVKTVPSSGEKLPAVGLGSWITFNVGDDPELRRECTAVMVAFFEAGGRVIDSSPMYGSSQSVIGQGLRALGHPKALFSADKVWTSSGGADQVAESRTRWTVPRFDLLQVHNLVAWEEHLPMLMAMKADGSLGHVGITTSEGRRHDLFEAIMRDHELDFVQLTYNIVDRAAERRLLPLAMDRGMAVLANRPFRQGALTRRLARHPLPPWASDIGARSWAQFILKFIVSHPAVTCAIPATTRVDHVRENVEAAAGPLPDAAMRDRMAAHVEGL
jgi:diketogulonate reductase-like aldo/keto reductase